MASVSKKLVVLIAGALAVVVGAGTGVYFLKPDLLPGISNDKSVAFNKFPSGKSDKKKKHEIEVGADLDVFVVNLAGSGVGRYLRTSLSLGVRDSHEKEKLKEFNGPIRHAVIMYLTERRVEELMDPTGRDKLRVALRQQINDAIGEKMVSNVYFKEFLIQ